MGAQPVSKLIGHQVGRLRTRRGWSQRELAVAVREHGGELGRGAIAKIESGVRGVSIDEALLLAAALNVPPVALFIPLDGSKNRVHVTDKSEIHPQLVLEWFIGVRPLASTERKVIDAAAWQQGSYEVRLWHRLRGAENEVHAADSAYRSARSQGNDAAIQHAEAWRIEALDDLVNVRTEMKDAGVTPPRLHDKWSKDLEAMRLEGDR